jgi:hypothetical protein
MEQAWLKMLGAMVADWEGQFLGRLGVTVPGMPGGGATSTGGAYSGLLGGAASSSRGFLGSDLPSQSTTGYTGLIGSETAGRSTTTAAGGSFWKGTSKAGAGATMAGGIAGGMMAESDNPYVSSIGKGMQIGAIAGPWGMAVGAGVGAVVALFRDRTPEDVARDAGEKFGTKFSQATSDAILGDKKKLGLSEVGAELYHLSDIIKDAGGLNNKNLTQMTARLHDVFSMIETHQLTIDQGTKVLDDNWQAFAVAGTNALGMLDTKLVDIIKLNDQFGTESKAITDYIGSQATGGASSFAAAFKIPADALKSLDDVKEKIASVTDPKELEALLKQQKTLEGIIDATGIHSQAAASAMAGAIIADFNGMIAGGKSFADAIKEIDPAVGDLDAVLQKAGFNGGAAFDLIKSQIALAHDEIAGPALTAVAALSSGMISLGNMGKLDQDTFAGLGSQITQTFQSLVAQGRDGGQVMIAMQPQLQALWEEEQRFGFKADDATQALLDEAQAAGVVGEKHKSSNDQMIDALATLHTDLEGITSALTGKGGVSDAFKDMSAKAKDAIKDIPTKYNIDVDFTPHYRDGDNPDAGYAAWGGRVTTTGVEYFGAGGRAGSRQWPFSARGTDTVPAMLTPGEMVITDDQQRVIGALLAKGGGGAGGAGGDIVIHHQTVLDGRVIDERIDRVGQGNLESGRWRVAQRNISSRN